MMTNKIAIITGGSRGLGRNTAVNLARRGVDILFTYRTNQKEAESLIREAEAIGRMPNPSPQAANLFSLWPKRRFCPSAPRTKSQRNQAEVRFVPT
jgi:NAD(P)-dependent dehydrogenase (short-subunit alcohol dehydrogenase family)